MELLAVPSIATGAALASTLAVGDNVVARQLMPIATQPGSVTYSGGTHSPPGVLRDGDRLQVARIDAIRSGTAAVADVIDDESFGDFAVDHHVGNSMGMAESTLCCPVAVPVRYTPEPRPALLGAALIYQAHESLNLAVSQQS